IGVVCLGIYLLNKEKNDEHNAKIALTSTNVDFLKPVLPGEKVMVVAEKQYFRFNKLKCRVEMSNAMDQVVARGTISGMIIKNIHQK
ncbi:MAG: hydroxymyristoyl-ACP dehydratase, partial [Gramella sp.]|nr:hydroxymyristoyl-ACP dehydratase [Christiangramia sp.]